MANKQFVRFQQLSEPVNRLSRDRRVQILAYQRKVMVNLPCERLQADKVWSFIHSKEKNVRLEDRGTGRADCWTWTAICADRKLIPCWHVGGRDADAAWLFMEDLASRLATRVQLTTDGHFPYSGQGFPPATPAP